MKILHLALEAPYNEGWGYQENLLTKYQVKLGHDVTLITTCNMNSADSTIVSCEPEDYISPDGFRVIRLNHKYILNKKVSLFLKIFSIYDLLKTIQPDFVMIHGLSNFSALQVRKYVKKINSKCIIIADNHLDYIIGKEYLSRRFSTKILVKMFRLMNIKMQRVYSKIYGVTPWRCEYANKVFGIDEEKLDLLPAGADDEKIDYHNRSTIKKEICDKYDISNDDFLVITGGKIDEKKNIDKLMEAVSKIDNPKIKLLVFGESSENIRQRVESLSEHPNIRYIGWIPSEDTYNYFLAADLMFFPGGHSVMWEQACACGTPCVFKYFRSMDHCDFGGNCKFLYDDTVNGMITLINEILNPDVYRKMYEVASSDGRKKFLYSKLAEKSLEMLEN